MKLLIGCSLAALIASACTTTLASTNASPRTIIVNGEATVERMPDRFAIFATFRTRNSDKAAGLAELSAQAARVRDRAPGLEGLKDLRLEASSVKLAAIQDSDCVNKQGYGDDSGCPVTGRVGSLSFRVEGSPAAKAGQMLSLLSELGAEEVEIQSYSLGDPKKAEADVLAAAVADAREKAEAIAASSGARLGSLIKVQYGAGFEGDRFGGPAPAVLLESPAPQQVVTQQSVRPATNLDIAPGPITLNAKVVASFALE